MRRSFLAFGICLVLVLPALGDDKVLNPDYKFWSKLTVGTTYKFSFTGDIGGSHFQQYRSYKLSEKTDDKHVIEYSIDNIMPKQPSLPPGNLQCRKFVDKAVDPEEVPVDAYEKGKETLKVGTHEFKTRWYKAKYEKKKGAPEDLHIQVWICDDLPSPISSIKTVIQRTNGSVKLELVDIKVP